MLSYSIMIGQSGSLSRHEALKVYLGEHPELLGIDPDTVLAVQTEVPIIKHNRTIAQPDIIIEYAEAGHRRQLFVEIKSGSNQNVLKSLQRQLRKLRRHVRQKNIFGDVMGVFIRDGKLQLLND